MITPYLLQLGNSDWQYMTDDNFEVVRIYLDLAGITDEQNYTDKYNKPKPKLPEENDHSDSANEESSNESDTSDAQNRLQ